LPSAASRTGSRSPSLAACFVFSLLQPRTSFASLSSTGSRLGPRSTITPPFFGSSTIIAP
jgi:hypothetical protein